MKPVTPNEAAGKLCPFTFNGHRAADKCVAGMCMAWRVVHPRDEREDHSGAGQFMASEGVRTKRLVRREGPQGSMGRLVLDEVGVCARLEPETNSIK